MFLDRIGNHLGIDKTGFTFLPDADCKMNCKITKK
jgi:hypothetical protein